ncbi:DUF11 domain-containing protein [Paenibacillus sp. M.A.Huq-81]
MYLVNKTDRINVKWLSNMEGYSSELRIEENSNYIAYSYLVYFSKHRQDSVKVHTLIANRVYPSTAAFENKERSSYVHFIDVSEFVKMHNETDYKVDYGSTQDTIIRPWYLLVVYGSPFLPIRHLSIYYPHGDGRPMDWDYWIEQLPGTVSDLPWLAQLRFINERGELSSVEFVCSVTENRIDHANYESVRKTSTDPVLLVHQIDIAEPRMDLLHSADKTSIGIGEEIAFTTEIRNTSDVGTGNVQYRSCFPAGTVFIKDSLTLNDAPVPIQSDPFNCITVYLRPMPAGDVITASFKLLINSATNSVFESSGTLDYNILVTSGKYLTGNQASNLVKLQIVE